MVATPEEATQGRRLTDLFGLLRSLDLPLGDYAIFGSGPLIIRGIIEGTNDLDIITRGPTWDHLQAIGHVAEFEGGNLRVDLFEERLTFGSTWKYGEFDLDELIDTAEIIDDLPFVRLEHVIAYKTAAGRPKDLEHLRLLEAAG